MNVNAAAGVARAPHPHLLGNYTRAPITIVRGEGCWLYDDRGERYLDLLAGIAVCALGHAHPAIAEAVARQAATLVQVSNLFDHEPAGTLANRLAELSGFERVFFCNSGSEANEAALKLARKFAWRAGQRSRTTIVSCTGSFHGRTMGALAATANPAYHEGFEPLPLGFRTTPFNDVAALETAIDGETAAFIVEPVQGEGGVTAATPAFLAAARRLCDERGTLLIFDEIQCGMGRLGTLFAFQSTGVRPDLVTMAKALANGLPIGAMLIDARVASGLQPGDHGTTFGGSPVPCAAALAHLAFRDGTDLDAHVRRVGGRLRGGLEAIARDHPGRFGGVRGAGLMLGLPVKAPLAAATFVVAARDHERLILNAAGGNVLRFVPALTISPVEVDEALARLRHTIARVAPES